MTHGPEAVYSIGHRPGNIRFHYTGKLHREIDRTPVVIENTDSKMRNKLMCSLLRGLHAVSA